MRAAARQHGSGVRSAAALIAPCLCAAATAQAGPPVLRGPAPSAAFAKIKDVAQVHLVRLPGDRPGTWTCAITVGFGRQELKIGRYDATAGAVTLTNEANSLRFSTEFGLMLEPVNGLVCVFDRHFGSVRGQFLSMRNSPGLVFPAAVQIGRLTNGFKTPAVARIGGRLKLIYSARPDIVMQDLDLSNPLLPKVAGPQVVVARARAPGRILHSPTPIAGPDGDVEGLWLAEEEPLKQSFMLFKADLDPAHRPVEVTRSADRLGSGAVAGGKLLFARGFAGVFELDTAWLIGDVDRPGGRLEVFGAVATAPNLARTLVLASARVIPPARLPVPLHVGRLGIDPRLVLPIGSLSHRDATQRASVSFAIPPDSRLMGTLAPIQGLAVDVRAGSLAWTNSAWLRLQ